IPFPHLQKPLPHSRTRDEPEAIRLPRSMRPIGKGDQQSTVQRQYPCYPLLTIECFRAPERKQKTQIGLCMSFCVRLLDSGSGQVPSFGRLLTRSHATDLEKEALCHPPL